MRAWGKLSLAGVALLSGLGGWLWQWQETAALRKAVVSLRQVIRDVRADNVRLRSAVATGSETDAARQVQEEVARMRREIAQMDATLSQPVAPRPREAPYDPFKANRDPEKGPVRLEHFQDKGRATPSAAFQTAVWAMTKGVDDALAPLFAVSPAGREKLRTMLAGMTPAMQARFDPPEKIFGLLFATEIFQDDGFKIGLVSKPDSAGQVRLTVLRARNGSKNMQDKLYPFQLGPGGWQLPISDEMVDALPGMLAQLSMYVPPRTSAENR